MTAGPMLTAIETVYRGYRFRSRLEARWAVFFQTLGVPWEYEPEGFKLSTGEWYLPDFRVHLADGVLWCEVKPAGVAVELFERFVMALDAKIRGTVLREIPDPNDFRCYAGAGDGDDFHVWWGGELLEGCGYGESDIYYQFCICDRCGGVGFEFEGRSARIQCGCDKHGSDGDHTSNHPRILAAYRAARAARFEHGESG